MQATVEAKAASPAANANSSRGAPKKLFDFIPTCWLTQSDLADPAAVESLVISRGWAGSGAVLKPTSSAGGFGTLRLPSVGNAEFSRKVSEAAAMNVQPTEPNSPTWMLQPFQPQILTDGEYSFFFLLDPSAPSNGSGSTQLRFVHGGQKRPKAGSFLVQPTNGGLLTPWVPNEEQIAAARAIIDATPFGTAAATTKAVGAAAASTWSAAVGSGSTAAAPGLPDLLYVRVDCIRSPDPSRGSSSSGGGDLSEGPLLLMEVEAIEPDYYSHLSSDFDSQYFESVKAFLTRAGAWTTETNAEEINATTTAANAEANATAPDPSAAITEANGTRSETKATSLETNVAGEASTQQSRSPSSSLHPSAASPFTDPLSSRVRGASAVRTPAAAGAGVSHLIEHFEDVIKDETAEAMQARLNAVAAAAALQHPKATHVASAVDATTIASAVPSSSSLGSEVAAAAAANSATEPAVESEQKSAAGVVTSESAGGKRKKNKKKGAAAAAVAADP